MSDPFVTPEAILSYPHLWVARRPAKYPESKPKFSAALLFNKNDPTIQPMVQLYQAEIAAKYGKALPYDSRECLIDGARKYPNDPFYADKLLLITSRAEDDGAPEVKLDNNTPVINKGDIYGGIIVRGYVSFFPYTNISGIGCDLHAVMKIRDGEPLGDRVRVDTTNAFQGIQGAGPSAPGPQAPAGFGMPGPDVNQFDQPQDLPSLHNFF